MVAVGVFFRKTGRKKEKRAMKRRESFFEGNFRVLPTKRSSCFVGGLGSGELLKLGEIHPSSDGFALQTDPPNTADPDLSSRCTESEATELVTLPGQRTAGGAKTGLVRADCSSPTTAEQMSLLVFTSFTKCMMIARSQRTDDIGRSPSQTAQDINSGKNKETNNINIKHTISGEPTMLDKDEDRTLPQKHHLCGHHLNIISQHLAAVGATTDHRLAWSRER